MDYSNLIFTTRFTGGYLNLATFGARYLILRNHEPTVFDIEQKKQLD
jgi:hypothetical protein